MAENNSTGPSPRHYIFNLESTKIELHFDKSEYAAMTDEQKRELKGAFLFSGKGKCWVSRAKEPNLWRAKQVAESSASPGSHGKVNAFPMRSSLNGRPSAPSRGPTGTRAMPQTRRGVQSSFKSR